ncbi:hypothetical protein KHQ88_07030 [Mycoplasmatota bacterium]|nr:hypothetical protein KHQ88_07030 [Mycoplasmatota bacterium]
MKNLEKKMFNKKEKKDREKYGQVVFLKKYIKRYATHTKTMKWLLPLVAIVTSLPAIISLIQYINDGEKADLITFILFGLAAILWIINTIFQYTFFFDFIDEKVLLWKKELKDLNEKSND